MNTVELWKTVKEDLRVELSTGTFNSFISQTRLEKIEEDEKQF